MKKILLPTDFSENAWNAISYALQLFKDESCNFILLNTFMPKLYNAQYISVDSAKYGLLDPIKKASVKKLEDLKNRILKDFPNPKHNISQISSFNSLVDEINALQKGNVMDYIVMGTKGASGVKEILFGSNTVRVLKNITSPVIVVPKNFKYEKPHDILFPSNFEVDFKQELVQTIVDIATNHNSRINILNVSYYDLDLSEKQQESKEKLVNCFKTISHLFHNEKNQNLIHAITNFQIKSKINMLVMIKNKHTFFDNLFLKPVINQIGFNVSVHFLVISAEN